MKYLLLIFALFLASCSHETRVVTEVVYHFVDMQTYNEWGTTRMVPISRRAIPTEKEYCNNPMWISSKICRRYHAK